jgi:hypothetical protein
LCIFQRYRHVDYIMFENPNICNQFLNYWRSTGNQRLGIMYGRYGPHKDIPLAIKAEVAAIYEPPQVTVNYIHNVLSHLILFISKSLVNHYIFFIFFPK